MVASLKTSSIVSSFRVILCVSWVRKKSSITSMSMSMSMSQRLNIFVPIRVFRVKKSASENLDILPGFD